MKRFKLRSQCMLEVVFKDFPFLLKRFTTNRSLVCAGKTPRFKVGSCR